MTLSHITSLTNRTSVRSLQKTAACKPPAPLPEGEGSQKCRIRKRLWLVERYWGLPCQEPGVPNHGARTTGVTQDLGCERPSTAVTATESAQRGRPTEKGTSIPSLGAEGLGDLGSREGAGSPILA